MSEKCPIIAIDPGNRQSAYCVIDCNTLRPLEFGKVDNEELRNKLVFANEQGWQWAAIEMVASYGMAVGREVFDTVLWIGRFYEALSIQMAQKPRQHGHPRLCGPAMTTPSSSGIAGPRPHNRQDCLKCPAWSWKWTKGNSCKP